VLEEFQKQYEGIDVCLAYNDVLQRRDVDAVVISTPAETHYSLARRKRVEYDDPLISEFARHFGQPELRLTVDPDTRQITAAEVRRDAVCGCAGFVAEGLVGLSADEAEQEAGMRHHHFPCLASMGIDPDFGDTLMHISGNILKDNVGEQVKPYKRVQYVKPGARSD
jgi:hypothetical protein